VTGRGRRAVGGVILAVTLLVACGGGGADGDAAERGPEGELTVLGPFLPEPPLSLAALYLTIDNRTGVDDVLLGARTEVAGEVVLHGAGMTALEGMPLPAGEQTVLEPGGAHLMLIDVVGVAAGGVVPVTLDFAVHEPVTVEVPVAPLGATEAP
jgi:periplasmic copper chaperone A